MPVTLNRLLSDNIPVDPSKNTFLGNGSQTVFNLTGQIAAGSLNPSNLIVSLDGAIQEPGDDYSLNNSTLTFTTAPDSGAKIVIISRNSPFTYATNVPGDGTVTSNKIVAGNVTQDKLSTGSPFWNSSGNVALGHSNPATNLHLNYSNYGAILLGANNSTGFTISKETPANTFNIWTGAIGSGINRLCITSSGDIGIGGLTSPQSKVDIFGTIGFGLRSGGQNQPGYLSNIWQAGTAGYRFATLGSSYFDGTNWITNPTASFGSNNVSVINVDTSGISLNLNAGTGNTQRTDSSATFNSFERLRINIDGSVNTFNNPINNCPTTVKAYLNFDAYLFTVAGGGGGPAIGPGSTAIDQIVAGSSTIRWTWTGAWPRNHIGVIYYFNMGGNNAQVGGVDWSKGAQIISINGSFATLRLLGGPATITAAQVTGNGTTQGYQYQTFGVRSSFNIGTISRQAVGRYRATFKRPMNNEWFVVLDGGGNTGAGDGAWNPLDFRNDTTKNAYSTVNYIDFQIYNSSGTNVDQQYVFFAVLDHAYNENY